MGLFDIFSGDSGGQAATSAFRGTQRGINKADKKYEYYGGQALDAYNTAKPEALGYLDKSADQALPYLQSGLTPYQDLFDMGQQGVQDHYNLISNPDSIYDSELYQSAQTRGLDALNRGANARGMLASGNNTQDQIDYMRSHGIDYFNTLANQYDPYFNLAETGASGLASGNQGIARMYEQLGANKSNVATGTASGLANTNMRIADARADLNTQEGQAQADMYMNKYNADQAAQQNMWDAILGLGKAAMGAI